MKLLYLKYTVITKKSNVIIVLEPLPPKFPMVLDLLLPSNDSQMSTLDCASKCCCLLITMGAFFFCSWVELVLMTMCPALSLTANMMQVKTVL